jgi:hypothetical protein
MNTTSYHTTTDFFHKVVIIGDDFAAGVGDYMILGSAGGLAEYLKPLIKRNEKVSASLYNICVTILWYSFKNRCGIHGKLLMLVSQDRYQVTGS